VLGPSFETYWKAELKHDLLGREEIDYTSEKLTTESLMVPRARS